MSDDKPHFSPGTLGSGIAWSECAPSPGVPPRVIVLIATIPPRKNSCGRLLGEVAKQSRRPDGVILVLDGYGDDPAPACSLPVIAEHRTPKPIGAGARWLAVRDLNPEDIVVCLDDDVMLVSAPRCIAKLVAAAEISGAAGAMGRTGDGKFAPPGDFSRGDLVHGLGCGLTVRAKHLFGLQAFADEVKAAGGPDALGLLGDDDALVSAYLWKQGVKIKHATTGNIFAAPGTSVTSQGAVLTAKKVDPHVQRAAIRKATGWPWVGVIAPAVPGVRR